MNAIFNELRHDDSKVLALVSLAQRGDRNAFGELAELFRPTVFAVALRVLRKKTEADDLVQDVLLHAMVKLGQLREPERFAGWLRTMTRNMAINRMRGNHEFDAGGSGDDLLIQTAGRDRTALEEMLSGEDRALLFEALDRLKKVDRDTLVAHYMDGKPLKAMARELDVPLGTIKRRLHVARKRLAKLMGADP